MEAREAHNLNEMPAMLGDVSLDISRRLLTGPHGTPKRLQPQEAAVLSMLVEHTGTVVSRASIFARCWGQAPVGDDSLNRIVSRLRRGLAAVGSRRLEIETVPGSGYVFTVAGPVEARRAVPDAIDCWRMGLPVADGAAIELLETSLAANPQNASGWGWLAILHCKAAEYCAADECSLHILGCDRAAREALALDSEEAQARIALARLVPIFGNWSAIRGELEAILFNSPDNPVARHEMAVLEMATGRPSAAVPLIAGLVAEHRHAPLFLYKRMYHLWTLGEIGECESTALAALQLWPRHPAIWLARFWILMFTGRADNASRLVAADERPALPSVALEFLAETARIAALASSSAEREAHVRRCLAYARMGPANAVAALQALCALSEIDPAFAVARGYYMGEGAPASQARPEPGGLSVPDQHRRVTQLLFIPALRQMRDDRRFAMLCEDIGLSQYWRKNSILPDFLAERGSIGP